MLKNLESLLYLADQNLSASGDSSKTTDQLYQAMESLLKSTTETDKFLRTIDDIAYQTNLLALNAADIAVNTDSSENTFAGLAEEVKNLTFRIAENAKITKILINESVKKSEMELIIIEQITNSFMELKEQFKKVNAMADKISTPT